MPPLPEPLARFLLPGEGERPSKRERTRRQLLHATVEVIASRGVAGTTIQEIARVAGMAPGTVYNHFSTREEIFEALALALFTTLNERVVQSYQHIEDGAQRMSIGMRRFLWLAEVSAPWALLMIQLAMAHPQAIELVKPYSLADLRRAKAQGRFDVVDEEAGWVVPWVVGWFSGAPTATTADSLQQQPEYHQNLGIRGIVYNM